MSIKLFTFAIIKTVFSSFGGGFLSIPFYYQNFVESDFICENDFNHFVLIGNILPGPVYFYLSGLIGYNLFGFLGALYGLFLTSFPLGFIAILVVKLIDFLQIDYTIFIYALFPIILIGALNYLITTFKLKFNKLVILGLIILTFSAMFIINAAFVIIIYLCVMFILIKLRKQS